MKKLICLLAVLSLAAPVMADVNFTATDNGDGTVTVSYIATGGEAVRGIALAVDAGAANVADTAAISAVDAAFNTFIDFAYEDPAAYAVGDGDPLAEPTGPGRATLPAATVSVCMGVLDQGGNQAAGPASADLFTLALSDIPAGGTTFTIDADALRGGVVGDSVIVTNLPQTIPVGPGGCQCWGDSTGPAGVPDGAVSTSDMSDMLIILSGYAPTYSGPVPAGKECLDIAGPTGAGSDGLLSTSDMSALLIHITAYPPTYTGPCIVLP